MATLATITGGEVRAGDVHTQHETLINSLNRVGVRVDFNNHVCREEDIDGYYHSRGLLLVICQDNAKWVNQRVLMTSNDYDTLRHEAHHVIQDCVDGALGNDELDDLFEDPTEYNAFISAILTPEQQRLIASSYAERGADQAMIYNELEAFAVAAQIPASDISKVLLRVCGG